MNQFWTRGVMALGIAATVSACETPVSPVVSYDAPATADAEVDAKVKVNGNYTANVGASVPIIGEYVLSAKVRPNGKTTGEFSFLASTVDGTIDFGARVTCIAFDEALGRAWIGGVITRNSSTRPSHNGTNPIHTVGHDVWFRVADRSTDGSIPDRTTSLGFEGGGGIPTSAAYCAARPWANDGIAIASGDLTVR
jgi:hypothetical protein